MDTEPKSISLPVPDDSLREQVQALQHLVVSLLILVVIISGTLSIFLLRQWRLTSKEVAGLNNMITEFNKDRGAKNEALISKLTEFGRTHPDFVPILGHYGINPANATGTAPSSTTVQPGGSTKK